MWQNSGWVLAVHNAACWQTRIDGLTGMLFEMLIQKIYRMRTLQKTCKSNKTPLSCIEPFSPHCQPVNACHFLNQVVGAGSTYSNNTDSRPVDNVSCSNCDEPNPTFTEIYGLFSEFGYTPELSYHMTCLDTALPAKHTRIRLPQQKQKDGKG